MIIPQTQKFVDRFWELVDKSGDCWKWLLYYNDSGYGKFSFEGKQHRAHVIAYELTKGEVPKGKELDHLCRNRWCCNPAHLEAVSHRVNQLRGNTIMAENAKKTHCKRGHELSGQNLLVMRSGMRQCVKCNQIRSQARHKSRMQFFTIKIIASIPAANQRGIETLIGREFKARKLYVSDGRRIGPDLTMIINCLEFKGRKGRINLNAGEYIILNHQPLNQGNKNDNQKLHL